MIVGAAVCPGAPFLVDGSADALAGQVPEVFAACRAAVDAVRNADGILLLSTARQDRFSAAAEGFRHGSPRGARVLGPGTVLQTSGFGRSDAAPRPIITLPGADAPDDGPARVSDPAVGTVVGSSLLARAGVDAPVTAVEIGDGGFEAAAAISDLISGNARIGLLVIADGAACHGEAAPGKRNEAAAPFDRRLADALRAGDPGALARACADRAFAHELLATVEPLTALAALAAGHPPDRAHLMFYGAPFGVGYLVGLWQWC